MPPRRVIMLTVKPDRDRHQRQDYDEKLLTSCGERVIIVL